MVPFVAVALVSIKVYDHKFLHLEPLLHVAGDERYVWVDAEATSRARSCVMETSSQVDCPALLSSETSSMDAPLRRTSHRIQKSHSQHPAK